MKPVALMQMRLLFLIAIFLLPQLADGQSSKVTHSNISHFKRVYQSALQLSSVHSAPASYVVRIAGFGRVRLEFDQIKVADVQPEIITNQGTVVDNNPIVLLKGRAKTINGWEIATAALAYQNSKLVLMTSFLARSRVASNVNFIQLQHANVENPDIGASFQRTNSITVKNASCASPNAPLHNLSMAPLAYPLTGSLPNYSASSLKELELSLHADQTYISRHGSSSQYVLARINEVEAIYQAQFNLVFKINRLQFDSTLNLGSANAVTMLESFRTHLNNRGIFSSADMFHLLTGTDMVYQGSSSVIGIAYQGTSNPPDPGVVCRYTNLYTVGITERLSNSATGLVATTIAHEMGHNFGADHVASGIMAAAASVPYATSFSTASVATISGHISTHGACLSDVSEDPPPSASASPTPTPSSTPPPNGGGGGNGTVGGGGPDAPALDINASLQRNGAFSAEVNLSRESTDETCRVKLLAGPNKNKISYRHKILWFSGPVGNVTNFTINAVVDRSMLLTNKKGRRQKVFVMWLLDCSSVANSAYSAVKRIRPENVNQSNKLYFGQWANRLKCKLNGHC